MPMRKCSRDISSHNLFTFVFSTTRRYRLRLMGLLVTALTASCFNMVIGLLVDAVLWELLEDLCLRERIEKLHLGLDTVLGRDLEEDGLSGGERQWLAVARALWKQPAIVLLDEATSALDGATEEAVNNAIWKWAGEACIIYAAHRFATILQADRIVVLKEGTVAGIGRHEELLEQCEEYRTLYAAIT